MLHRSFSLAPARKWALKPDQVQGYQRWNTSETALKIYNSRAYRVCLAVFMAMWLVIQFAGAGLHGQY